jgi:hypothetical protein
MIKHNDTAALRAERILMSLTLKNGIKRASRYAPCVEKSILKSDARLIHMAGVIARSQLTPVV